jgi:hypothetical protein
MSSSRSIAAARNRRAGDPPASRPNTSIGSSNVFSQQPRGPPQVQRQQQQVPPQYQSQPQYQTQPPGIQQPKPKISVGDAIGLTTIRLCKVENFIKELKETGMVGLPELPPNTQLVDNSVLTSMINRLDALEKKEIACNEKIAQLEKEITNLTQETGEKFADFETALIDIEKQLPEQVVAGDVDTTQDVEPATSDVIAATDLKAMVREELSLEDIAVKSAL